MVNTTGLELILGNDTQNLVITYHNPSRSAGVGAIDAVVAAVSDVEQSYVTNFYVGRAKQVIIDGKRRFLAYSQDYEYETYLNLNIDALQLRATLSPDQNNLLGKRTYPHYDNRKILIELRDAHCLLDKELQQHKRNCERKKQGARVSAAGLTHSDGYAPFFGMSETTPPLGSEKVSYTLVVGFNGTSADIVEAVKNHFIISEARLFEDPVRALHSFYDVMRGRDREFRYGLILLNATLLTLIHPENANDPCLLLGSAASSHNVPIIALGVITHDGIARIERTRIYNVERLEDLHNHPGSYTGRYTGIEPLLKKT